MKKTSIRNWRTYKQQFHNCLWLKIAQKGKPNSYIPTASFPRAYKSTRDSKEKTHRSTTDQIFYLSCCDKHYHSSLLSVFIIYLLYRRVCENIHLFVKSSKLVELVSREYLITKCKGEQVLSDRIVQVVYIVVIWLLKDS
jgi:hypothetical protein